MAYDLNNVIKKNKVRPPRVLLYAPPKVGKSYFAGHIPNNLFIDLEDGLDGVRATLEKEGLEVASTGKLTDTQQVVDVLRALYEQEHNYKSLTIDTADWLEKLICNEIAQQNNKSVVEDIPYGKGWPMVVDRWTDFLKYLDVLRNEKDMMIMFLAHADIKKYSPPLGDEYDIYTPKLYGKKDKNTTSLALIQEFCDVIMFANFDIETKEVGEGFSKRRVALKNPERVLHLSSSNPSFVAGNRYGMVDKVPFTYDNFWKAFQHAINNNKENKQEEKINES